MRQYTGLQTIQRLFEVSQEKISILKQLDTAHGEAGRGHVAENPKKQPSSEVLTLSTARILAQMKTRSGLSSRAEL